MKTTGINSDALGKDLKRLVGGDKVRTEPEDLLAYSSDATRYYAQGKPDAVVHRDVTYELEQYPEDKTEERLERHCAPAIRYHMKNLLAAIATRGRPVADIEQGYISAASCILANMSMKLGRTLAWDPQRNQVVGDEEANRLLRRPYRKPWVHPDPERV